MVAVSASCFKTAEFTFPKCAQCCSASNNVSVRGSRSVAAVKSAQGHLFVLSSRLVRTRSSCSTATDDIPLRSEGSGCTQWLSSPSCPIVPPVLKEPREEGQQGEGAIRNIRQ